MDKKRKLIGSNLKKIIITVTLPKWDKLPIMEIRNEICGGKNYRSFEVEEQEA